MSTQLNFARDVQGMNAYAPATATNKWNATLTAGNSTTITVPSTNVNWVAAFSFQPGTTVWVDLTGATALAPTTSTLSSCTSEQNPGSRAVKAGSTISMITNNTTSEVGVILYAV